MKESNLHVVRPGTRDIVDHPHSRLLQLGNPILDARDGEGNVVESLAPLFQECSNRTGRIGRLQQFETDVAGKIGEWLNLGDAKVTVAVRDESVISFDAKNGVEPPAFAYRFDWETPEGGGHMRSPHTIEVPFVFNNIKVAGPLISKMPQAYALADKVSAAWVAFARTGNPNTPGLPKWPAYSTTARDTMLFNNASRVEQDPDREPRLVMEQLLKLT